ncbi:MAG: hypothetical protein ACOX0Z_01965 [Candidatus Nanosyncoccaceae bacterium]|jgi:hypothetical protein
MKELSSENSLEQLVKQLKSDHPEIKFIVGDNFCWSPASQTLFYKDNDQSPKSLHLLLHELAHAKLKHEGYFYDNELVKLELAAWEYSRHNFYPRYVKKFNQALADYYLEYYRNWLYKRSLCPNCQSTGQQADDLIYNCPICGQKWQSNEAKFTRIKKQKLK